MTPVSDLEAWSGKSRLNSGAGASGIAIGWVAGKGVVMFARTTFLVLTLTLCRLARTGDRAEPEDFFIRSFRRVLALARRPFRDFSDFFLSCSARFSSFFNF